MCLPWVVSTCLWTVAAELVKPHWHAQRLYTEDFTHPFLGLLKTFFACTPSTFIFSLFVTPVMSKQNVIQKKFTSINILNEASLWVEQGVRWLMRRKEDLRRLAVTWKEPCCKRLYASQCQTWSCCTQVDFRKFTSWDKYDHLPWDINLRNMAVMSQTGKCFQAVSVISHLECAKSNST